MKKALVIAFLAAVALAGCWRVGEEASGPTTVTTSGWDRQWQDGDGNLVDERVISTVRGPEHCDWESAVFLYVGWPLGTRSSSADDARQYVRDPDGLFSAFTAGPFNPDAALPTGARYTGYHLDDVALWVADDAAEGIYLVRGDIERWPRANNPIACA